MYYLMLSLFAAYHSAEQTEKEEKTQETVQDNVDQPLFAVEKESDAKVIN